MSRGSKRDPLGVDIRRATTYCSLSLHHLKLHRPLGATFSSSCARSGVAMRTDQTRRVETPSSERHRWIQSACCCWRPALGCVKLHSQKSFSSGGVEVTMVWAVSYCLESLKLTILLAEAGRQDCPRHPIISFIPDRRQTFPHDVGGVNVVVRGPKIVLGWFARKKEVVIVLRL